MWDSASFMQSAVQKTCCKYVLWLLSRYRPSCRCASSNLPWRWKDRKKWMTHKKDGLLKRQMNWSNKTIAFTIIAQLELPNLTVSTQAGWVFSSRLQVILYRTSAFTFTLLQYDHMMMKTIIFRHTQPFTVSSHIQHSSVFCKGYYSRWPSDLRRGSG